MPKFVSKTHTKDSPADHNYANDLEKRIGDAIDPLDTLTENFLGFPTEVLSGQVDFYTIAKPGAFRAGSGWTNTPIQYGLLLKFYFGGSYNVSFFFAGDGRLWINVFWGAGAGSWSGWKQL